MKNFTRKLSNSKKTLSKILIQKKFIDVLKLFKQTSCAQGSRIYSSEEGTYLSIAIPWTTII